MVFEKIIDLDITNPDGYTEESFQRDLPLFTELLDFAEEKDIHCIWDMEDEANEDSIEDVFDYLDIRVSNTNVMKQDMKDLSPILSLYDRMISLLDEDDDFLYFVVQKVNLLFKMRKYDQGEAFMMEYINQYPDEGHLYEELMFDFDALAGDRESAIYYGHMALARENLEDRESIEDLLSDLE